MHDVHIHIKVLGLLASCDAFGDLMHDIHYFLCFLFITTTINHGASPGTAVKVKEEEPKAEEARFVGRQVIM